MSKITNGGLTRSGAGCSIDVTIRQQRPQIVEGFCVIPSYAAVCSTLEKLADYEAVMHVSGRALLAAAAETTVSVDILIHHWWVGNVINVLLHGFISALNRRFLRIVRTWIWTKQTWRHSVMMELLHAERRVFGSPPLPHSGHNFKVFSLE